MTVRKSDKPGRLVDEPTLRIIDRMKGIVLGAPGTYIQNQRSGIPRRAKISVESGSYNDGLPYVGVRPAELGYEDGSTWVGSGVWITLKTNDRGYLFKDEIVRAEFYAGQWHCTDTGKNIVFGNNGGGEINPAATGSFSVSGETITATNPTGVYIQSSALCMLIYRGNNQWYCLPFSC